MNLGYTMCKIAWLGCACGKRQPDRRSAQGIEVRPNLQCPCGGYHQTCPFEGSPHSSSRPFYVRRQVVKKFWTFGCIGRTVNIAHLYCSIIDFYSDGENSTLVVCTNRTLVLLALKRFNEESSGPLAMAATIGPEMRTSPLVYNGCVSLTVYESF